jgi:hypothetical protein
VRDATAALRRALVCREATDPLVRWVAERAIDQRDPRHGTDVEDISHRAALIAGGAGFDHDRCQLIRLGGPGAFGRKNGHARRDLSRAGGLSPSEFDAVMSHAEQAPPTSRTPSGRGTGP